MDFLKKDLEQATYKPGIGQFLFNPTWRFMRNLRRAEYVTNCKSGRFWRFMAKILVFRVRRLGNRLGYSIPLNTCGPGLCLPHVGTIVINRRARLGTNCKVHVCVNIGADFNDAVKVPRIDDHCYIGPGAKIFGDVYVAEGTVIGANAVVNKTISKSGMIVAGVPAKVIGERS